MTLYEDALQLTNRMSLFDKVRLMEHLSTMLKSELEVEAFKHIPWNQFIDLTYGSLADDPLERQQPLQADIRDEIE
jgi:hypothetical protein